MREVNSRWSSNETDFPRRGVGTTPVSMIRRHGVGEEAVVAFGEADDDDENLWLTIDDEDDIFFDVLLQELLF